MYVLDFAHPGRVYGGRQEGFFRQTKAHDAVNDFSKVCIVLARTHTHTLAHTNTRGRARPVNRAITRTYPDTYTHTQTYTYRDTTRVVGR